MPSSFLSSIMRRKPEWKIANNFGSKDSVGAEGKSYSFFSGLHERYSKRFEGRLKILLSSGIYQLWSRWERVRFSKSGLRHDAGNLEPMNGSPDDPLSFENSATWWLFWGQSLAWLCSLAALFAELMCDIALRKCGRIFHSNPLMCTVDYAGVTFQLQILLTKLRKRLPPITLRMCRKSHN